MKPMLSLMTVLFPLVVALCGGWELQAQQGKKPKETLHEATFFGYLDKVKQHIAYGTDLNQKDDYGSTALNVAITFNRTDVALELIDAGADLSITSPDGSTPLHLAAFFGRVDVVDALIAKGVDLQPRNSYGSTPLETAEAPFDQLKPIYDQLSRDLGPMGFKLDYEKLKVNLSLIAVKLQQAINQSKGK